MVIIDAGSRGISEKVPKKSEVNECMKNLWRWAKSEIAAPFEGVRELWQQMHTLQDAVSCIDAMWARAPIVTVEEMATAEVDAQLRGRRFSKTWCRRALMTRT